MDHDTLQALLDELLDEHGGVGGSVAVLAGDELTTATGGVLNLRTGVPVTPDSVFQIGSVTKVFTTTLVMQLVDDGALRLDTAVTDVLPGVVFGPPGVTVAQLLQHTSGVFGDHFGAFPALDHGHGDDAVERYVAGLGGLPQIHDPGAAISYCNSGFVVAGRIVEVLTGQRFAVALRERVLDRLGLRHAAATTEEAILHSVAVGHVPADPADPSKKTVTPWWSLPPALAPAGSLLCLAPADLSRFGRAHLDGGAALGLTEGTAAAMQRHGVDVPGPNALGLSGWGLGWFLLDWGGARVFGHDGGAMGQTAVLRVVPDAGLVVAASLNGATTGGRVFEGLLRAVAGEAGIEVSSPPSAPIEDADPAWLDGILGAYEQPHLRLVARRDGGRLVADITPRGPNSVLAGVPATDGVALTRVAPNAFTAQLGPASVLVTFHDPGGGVRPTFAYVGARAFPRAE